MPPKKAYEPLYAIVQHSGYGYADKIAFKHGLEIRTVDTETAQKRVHNSGGIMFRTFAEADKFIDDEMYPGDDGPGLTLTPRAPGSFSDAKIDNLRIYQPVNRPAVAVERTA